MDGFRLQILDSDDFRLLGFRSKIYSDDLNIDPAYARKMLSHSQCKQIFGPKIGEEAYKFGDLKWKKTKFDGICVALTDNDDVVSMSGFKRYGKFLRVGMHLYTLKSWRRLCRSLLWKDGGFIDLALNSPDHRTVYGTFISIYPHNRILKKWSHRLSRGRDFGQLANDDRSIEVKMASFELAGENIQFNNVPQNIFFMKNPQIECNRQFSKDLINVISSDRYA